MKINLKQVSVAGTLLALSSTAFAELTQTQINTAQTTASATINGTPSTTGGFSSLVFFAYNPDGSFSQVETLGIRGSTNTLSDTLAAFSDRQTNDPGTSLSFALDNGGVGGLLNSNASALRWGIVSFDNVGDGTLAATFALLSTVNTATSDLSATGVLPNTQGVKNTGDGIALFLATNPSATEDSIVSTTPDASNNWTTTNLNSLQLTSTIFATGSATSTLAMYMFTNVASASTGAIAAASAYAGTWSLDTVAGTVNYSVNAVPVPAAVWLLLSGLGGLGVVGRRRRALAAA